MDMLDASSLFRRRPEQPPSDPSELTYHSARPERLIDWVLIPADWQFVDYRVVSSTLSDHRPVVTGLLMPPEEDPMAD